MRPKPRFSAVSSRIALVLAVIATLVMLPVQPALADVIQLISKAPGGGPGNGHSTAPAVSADGRWVAFCSLADNLIEGVGNGKAQVFLYDRLEGRMSLVSRGHDGGPAEADCTSPDISADGRYIAFTTASGNVVNGDSNGFVDVFVHDRRTGQTSLASLNKDGGPADNWSYTPSISADGRYVAFYSPAGNLVEESTSGIQNIFLRDRQEGVTHLISKSLLGNAGNGDSQYPHVSADGRFVAFCSEAVNMVLNDNNAAKDVFVRDRQNNLNYLVSKSSGGTPGNGVSLSPWVSPDGNLIAFYSYADNLVEGDTNGAYDVFLRLRSEGQTILISRTPEGGGANGDSGNPVMSEDGRFIVYHSYADNLVEGDGNGKLDVFLNDRETGRTTRVSRTPAGGSPDGESRFPAFSSSGRFVTFYSYANDLVPGDADAYADVYLTDLYPNRALYGGALLLLPKK